MFNKTIPIELCTPRLKVDSVTKLHLSIILKIIPAIKKEIAGTIYEQEVLDKIEEFKETELDIITREDIYTNNLKVYNLYYAYVCQWISEVREIFLTKYIYLNRSEYNEM